MKKTLFEKFVIGAIIIVGIAVIIAIAHRPFTGTFPFGPTRILNAKVTRLYVDAGKESSYYMVGTDAGVFEVENSLWLWIWNADELYSKIETGKRYSFTTKGNKLANWFAQQYPRITKVKELE